jgi:hypothetical protein
VPSTGDRIATYATHAARSHGHRRRVSSARTVIAIARTNGTPNRSVATLKSSGRM